MRVFRPVFWTSKAPACSPPELFGHCTIKLGELNAENLGYLIQALEVQTAIAGDLYGVNAFDQPGVEAGKQITYKRMGRPGY
jgi:glucose-6-phosphate isomerase